MAKAGGGGGGTSRFRSTTTGGSISKVSESGNGVNPYIQVTYKVPGTSGETVTETTTLSGTTTDTLTISCDSVKTQEVFCTVDGSSIPTIPTSITSNTAKFYSISQSNLETSEVIVSIIDDLSGTYSASTTNLFQTNVDIQADDSGATKSYIVYATKDIPVTITLIGSGGAYYGSRRGGNGGKTVFDYTLSANTEYVFKIGKNMNDLQGGEASYFYEKGTLLVVSGGGGSSGSGGNGGNGGGAGVQGSSGTGSGAGQGGVGIIDGTLPGTGQLYSGITGGRVEACTTGYYWATQGKDPCADLGKVKYFTATGSQVSNSTDSITRGFKADISYPNGNLGFRLNGGSSKYNNGGGGSGATGGNANSNGVGGGGGGSGYTNGAVTVTSTGVNSSTNTSLPGRFVIELRT